MRCGVLLHQSVWLPCATLCLSRQACARALLLDLTTQLLKSGPDPELNLTSILIYISQPGIDPSPDPLRAGTGSSTPCGPSGTCCSGTCIVPSGCRGTTYAGAICCPSARSWPLDTRPQEHPHCVDSLPSCQRCDP